MDEDWVQVRYVGGSHDGAVRPLPSEFAVVGYPQVLPPRHRYAVPEVTPPLEPTIMAPDASWERYVLREDAGGWAFDFAGQLGPDARGML